MLHVLNEINARHFGLHLLFLIVLVFVATPIVKHLMFNRARGGSVYLPRRKFDRKAGEVRQAERYLAERDRRKAADEADPG